MNARRGVLNSIPSIRQFVADSTVKKVQDYGLARTGASVVDFAAYNDEAVEVSQS